MSTTIEEAAREFADNADYPAPDYDWSEGNDEQMKEYLSDTFKAGANYILSLPLASRMTEDEKERALREYDSTYPYDIDCGVTNILLRDMLERIFGKDFFKEGE